jgi:hypothetical protein
MIVLGQLKKILTQDLKMKIFLKIFKGLMVEKDNSPICKIFNLSLKTYLEGISEDLAEEVEIEVLQM